MNKVNKSIKKAVSVGIFSLLTATSVATASVNHLVPEGSIWDEGVYSVHTENMVHSLYGFDLEGRTAYLYNGPFQSQGSSYLVEVAPEEQCVSGYTLKFDIADPLGQDVRSQQTNYEPAVLGVEVNNERTYIGEYRDDWQTVEVQIPVGYPAYIFDDNSTSGISTSGSEVLLANFDISCNDVVNEGNNQQEEVGEPEIITEPVVTKPSYGYLETGYGSGSFGLGFLGFILGVAVYRTKKGQEVIEGLIKGIKKQFN